MDLQTVPVEIENGVIRSLDGSPLPDRARALLVIMPETPENQAAAEWQVPFEAYFEAVRRHASAGDLSAVSDEALNALVHSARRRS